MGVCAEIAQHSPGPERPFGVDDPVVTKQWPNQEAKARGSPPPDTAVNFSFAIQDQARRQSSGTGPHDSWEKALLIPVIPRAKFSNSRPPRRVGVRMHEAESDERASIGGDIEGSRM